MKEKPHMKEKKPVFNQQLFKEIVDETFKDKSRRKMAHKYGIHRNSFYKWLRKPTKRGPNDESWDKILLMFAQLGIHRSKWEFYYYEGEEGIMLYKQDALLESKLSDSDPEIASLLKNPHYLELFEENNKLKTLLIERAERIVELHEKMDKLEEKVKMQDELIENLQKQVADIK